MEESKVLLLTRVAKGRFLEVTCDSLAKQYKEVFDAYGIESKDVIEYVRTKLLKDHPDLHVEFVQTCIAFFYEEYKNKGKKYESWKKAFAEAIDSACIYFCNCVNLEVEVNSKLIQRVAGILRK